MTTNTNLLDTWEGDKVPLKAKAIMGFAGLTIHDESVDVLDMMSAFMEKAAGESCGQCFPCRSGLKKIAKRLSTMCEGKKITEDNAENLAYIKDVASMISKGARCDIGQTSTKALIDIIDKAPNLLTPRKVQRQDYTSLVTAPCMNACPGHVDIPTYIERIRLRQFNKGLDCVLDKCAMPGTIGRVCNRPCESACKRGQNGEPISIRHLKRFLFDKKHIFSTSFAEKAIAQKPEQRKEKIAVIGAGPAGLSCAYYLSQVGFPVTIFEKHESAGGMAKFGIPDYRLPANILNIEVANLEKLGCEIRYGVDVGKDIRINELIEQGYKAIFIGTGAPNAPNLNCENEEHCTNGFVSGIEYLNEATKGNKIISGKRVVVVGGGNVAMDCVRTALRHGFEDVHIIYRRTEQEMPADKVEIHEAKLEGVQFNFLVAPIRIKHEDGHVRSIVCQKMKLGEPDASGRCRPVPIEGELLELECDVIIPAIGQKVALEYIIEGVPESTGTGLDKYKNLMADPLTGKVDGLPYIFGGGDCVTDPSTLISALAAGKRAALHMANFAMGEDICATEKEKLEQALHSINLLNDNDEAPITDLTEPMPLHVIPVEHRLEGFEEVEKGSSVKEACLEASRCLRCFRILMVAS